jgi:RING finger protein 113A
MADTQEKEGTVQTEQNEGASSVCTFKKPVRSKNTRKRSGEESAQTDETPTVVIAQKDKAPTKSKPGQPIAQTKAQGIETFSYQSSGTATSLGSTDQGATAIVETETQFDRDGVAIKKRAKATQNDGLYHGANQYREYIQKREESSGLAKGAGLRAGPVRASSHIRVTARFDYQPDLCKDYKETGYCGYGDACKFMHDRGDYKTGWQLEREWDESEKQKAEDRQRGNKQDDKQPTAEEDEDDLPFACFVCRQPFTHPVVTKCKHYFCEKCALQNHAKTKKCFVCNEPTGGIFNMPGKQILAKLEAKKKRFLEQQQEQEQEQGQQQEQEAGGDQADS